MRCSTFLKSVALVQMLWIALPLSAQINEFDIWIEPGCPKSGDAVTLYVDYRQGGRTLMYPPFQVARSGSNISVSYTSFYPFFCVGIEPVANYPVPVPLGSLEQGTYKINAQFIGASSPAVSIEVLVSSANAGAQESSIWNNPAAPGYGITIVRGDRHIAGTHYTYRRDKTSHWQLLQRAFCTPTGYAGSFIGYNNGVHYEMPDSSFTVPPSAFPEGRWTFDFTGTNTAKLVARGNLYTSHIINTRSLTRFVVP